MSSSNKKTIAVIGATGNQGSSVATTFLALPDWHVRAVTRNPSSQPAQKLANLGAEVIKADLSDPTSLAQAFKNANAIFVNTDFWETYGSKFNSEKAFDLEVSHGKNAVIAAANVGSSLEMFIYSALGPMKEGSKGKYPHSYHWDSKAAIVQYIEQEQVELAKKTSFIYLGAYNTNPLFTPRFDESSGKWIFAFPMTKEGRMPIIDPVLSTGPFVHALVVYEKPGTKLLAYDNYLTISKIVEVWSDATGKEGVFVETSAEAMHKQFGIPLEVLDAPKAIGEFGFMVGIEGFIEPTQLKKKVMTPGFGEWLKERNLEELQQASEATLNSVTK